MPVHVCITAFQVERDCGMEATAAISFQPQVDDGGANGITTFNSQSLPPISDPQHQNEERGS